MNQMYRPARPAEPAPQESFCLQLCIPSRWLAPNRPRCRPSGQKGYLPQLAGRNALANELDYKLPYKPETHI